VINRSSDERPKLVTVPASYGNNDTNLNVFIFYKGKQYVDKDVLDNEG
jgi:hypothetical protein